jgi:ESCRT-II complex subunit VPS36
MTSVSLVFLPIAISSSGLPALLNDEVELRSEEGVEILQENGKNKDIDILPKGHVIATNFRIVVVTKMSVELTAWACNLNCVRSLEDCSTFFRASSRVKLHFNDPKCGQPVFLKFHEGGKKDFQLVLQRAVDKKSWLSCPQSPYIETTSSIIDTSGQTVFDNATRAATSSAAKAGEAHKASNAGISGILRRQEEARQNVDSLTKLALNDLESLMQRGREVVNVVQRYAAYAAADTAAASETSSAASTVGDETSTVSDPTGETSEMEAIMQSIGIVSPVTKFSAGRLYHKQLARQIADILLQQNRLAKLGGMVTLIDLYSLYNRARGTELVSPDDLLAACKLCDRMRLRVKLRRFESTGVMVMELTDLDYSVLVDKVTHFAQERYTESGAAGILPSHVAAMLNMSLFISNEILSLAEKQGRLCRDDSVHGIEYYPNKFGDYLSALTA